MTLDQKDQDVKVHQFRDNSILIIITHFPITSVQRPCATQRQAQDRYSGRGNPPP